MNARFIFAVVAIATTAFAQSDEKFRIYGFADMSITKYFPKENSSIRNVDKMDERLNFSFDHLNLYQEFKPTDRVRLLAELSYQDKPVNYKSKNGWRVKSAMSIEGVPMPPILSDSVWTQPESAPSNKTQKGINIYEWGSISVERALFTLYLSRYMNLSFGKFITPAGIWNVDHGSPVIMTINQPSQYSFVEIYPKSQLGIMGEGTVFLGDGDLSYSLYFSSGRNNPSIKKPTDISVGGQLRFGIPVLDEFRIGLSGYTGKVRNMERWMISDMAFTLSSDFLTYTTHYNITTMNDVVKSQYRENIFGIDTRIRKSGFCLQSEFNYLLGQNQFKNNATSGILATYVLGSYDAYKSNSLNVTPYAYYERVKYIKVENDSALFNSFGEGSQTMFRGYHKVMGGVNLRIFTNFGMKLEYNFTRIIPAPPEVDKDKLYDVPGIASQFYVAF